jgi:tRNA dimethylallyltransferase
VIGVVGPTAVGKTSLAEELALALNGEVVSADSMQIYRGMDIGTAKPHPDTRRVPYHCLDIVAPGEPYSAARFQADARAAIADIAARSRLPLVVGGTGLYLRAALDDMHFLQGHTDDSVRRDLEREAEAIGGEALHARLQELDPDSAARIHPHNVRRTIRALEMLRYGHSYDEQAAGFNVRQSVYDTRLLGLTMHREHLYARIDRRVTEMLDLGLLDEIRGLLDAGLRDALTAAQAIGYKEFVPVIEQGASLTEAISAVQQATRRFAKRQLTWFRSDPRIAWIDVTELSPQQATSTALDLLESGRPAPYSDTTS